MHRPTIGVIALVLLATALVLALWPFSDSSTQQFESACWRIGAVMAALWLAHPQLKRLPRWALPALLVLILVIARWPRMLALAIAILLAFAFLRPRAGVFQLWRR